MDANSIAKVWVSDSLARTVLQSLWIAMTIATYTKCGAYFYDKTFAEK